MDRLNVEERVFQVLKYRIRYLGAGNVDISVPGSRAEGIVQNVQSIRFL